MRTIRLVNPPFGFLAYPSIGLTQLIAALRRSLDQEVSASVIYLNHDFGQFLEPDAYDYIAHSQESVMSGLGDWFFRQSAFPGIPDNTEQYWTRYRYQFPSHVYESYQARLAPKRGELDAFLDEVVGRYHLDEADLVGCTSMFGQNTASFALARRIKERNPAVTFVMGGANCEMPMGRAVLDQVRSVDYVFSGCALKSFPEFVRAWLVGDMDKCSSIDGVLGRNNATAPMNCNGKGHLVELAPPRTGGRPFVVRPYGEDLDINVGLKLDYTGFLESLERAFGGRIQPELLFETSRGCWWGERMPCSFCGANGSSMMHRAMRPEVALEHFASLFAQSEKVFRLGCVDSLMPKKYPQEVCRHLKTPPHLTIHYEVRVDMSLEDLRALAEGRVKSVQPGIEALNTGTLRLMKKGTTAFQNIQFLKNCVIGGPIPSWNLLIGSPGESEDVYRKYAADIPLLAHLPPPRGVFPVRFDRFSPYVQNASLHKLDLQPLEFYGLVYPFDESILRDIAYYFFNADFSADYVQAAAKWILPLRQLVTKWVTAWTGRGQLKARLEYAPGDRRRIYDSRRGYAVHHDLSSAECDLLEHLSTPCRIEEVGQRAAPGASDSQKAIDHLRSLGLLFQEDNRYLSLVCGSPDCART